jgi:hypothetical protein
MYTITTFTILSLEDLFLLSTEIGMARMIMNSQ